MESVFVSSVISDFEEIRSSVREAIESAGFRAVMAETAGAMPISSKQGLLNLVAGSDIYLLILGSRYGERTASGFSPTEDEFNEAKRRHKRIVVLKQADEMELAQTEFLQRAAGRWDEGLFYATFDDERDVALKVVRALTNIRQLDDLSVALPRAQELATALARGEERSGYYHSGGEARVVFVPVGDLRIIDELMLNDEQLGDQLSAVARFVGLVPQALTLLSCRSTLMSSTAAGPRLRGLPQARLTHSTVIRTCSSLQYQ